jgi:hypothetical protein
MRLIPMNLKFKARTSRIYISAETINPSELPNAKRPAYGWNLNPKETPTTAIRQVHLIVDLIKSIYIYIFFNSFFAFHFLIISPFSYIY